MRRVRSRSSSPVFRLLHATQLVYNTCWEDPRLDRVALGLRPDDEVLVITSAGCNALDYALAGPRRIYAVDLNPRQNALLELKIAGIRHLEFEDFFALFGQGRCPRAHRLYGTALRSSLSPWSQSYWDRWIGVFAHPQRSFYFRGTCGAFARLVKFYLDRIVRVRADINELLETKNLREQQAIYHRRLRDRVWTRALRFAVQRDAIWALVGVPRSQRLQLERQYAGGIAEFLAECLDAVFGQLPLADNYFWRVYLTGSYTSDCCPEYLKADNFQRLKSGLVEAVIVHTGSLQAFLERHSGRISRYALLDHMDWLADGPAGPLAKEWQAMIDRAASNVRFIWRSAGRTADFLEPLRVRVAGQSHWLTDVLQPHSELASELHCHDRVHTYGSFHIADLRI